MDAPLALHAREQPDAVALLHEEAVLTWAELDASVTAAAAALAAAGVGAGTPVGVLMGSHLEHVVAVYAIWRAGGVWVPLNPLLSERDLAHVVETTSLRLALADTELAGQLSGLCNAVALDALPPAERELPPVPETADAVIAFTSGTTGRAKGVVHRHRALRSHSRAVAAHYAAGADDAVLCLLPLHLLSIFLVGPALGVEAGAPCRVLPRYDPAAFAAAVRRDRTTIAAAVPVLFADLVGLPAERAAEVDLASLRIVSCGGAPLPQELRDDFERRFDFRIVQAFGGTEAPGIVATDPIAGLRRAGSVGRALPHVRITAIDDAWNDLPPGEVGDLCTGPAADGTYEPMRAYLGQPEATEGALRDGRLRWGDVGYVDEDGFVFLVDRRHDVIIRGGMNVYPRQVEEVAYELEGVVECAVVGIPDTRLGEVPIAFVRTAVGGPDADAVQEFVNARVARYAHLAEVRLVDDFPRNALGKVLKRELRAHAAEEC